MGGGGDSDGDVDGLRSRRVSLVSVIRIRSSRTGDGVRPRRSIILSRTRTGDGERSRTLSLVSITLARSRSGGVSDRSRSRSTILDLILSMGGREGDLSLSITLSLIRTGLGDLGRLSIGLSNVSVCLSLNTSGPPSGLP